MRVAEKKCVATSSVVTMLAREEGGRSHEPSVRVATCSSERYDEVWLPRKGIAVRGEPSRALTRKCKRSMIPSQRSQGPQQRPQEEARRGGATHALFHTPTHSPTPCKSVWWAYLRFTEDN
jgi:hypothetical protein